MSGASTPLFVDTGAFFARFNERAYEHDRALAVFDAIGPGDGPYGPLFTSRYVLSDLATLMLGKIGHGPAVESLELIRGSDSFNVLSVGAELFDRACRRFAKYDDQHIPFVDHTSGVLAGAYDIDHVFTFDSDDFRTLGFTVVPDDTGEV